MKTLGIIPAAGKAERFGGILKELLPARNGIPLMMNLSFRMPDFCTKVVVTNYEKIESHSRVLESSALYAIQFEEGLKGAVMAAMEIKADRYYFAMPDTDFYPNLCDVFKDAGDFALGTFRTNKPERFGVFYGNEIIDKRPSKDQESEAWGALTWTKEVRKLWYRFDHTYSNFTDMINHAMSEFGYSRHSIGKYYDMATIQDYKEYLCG